MNEKQNGGPEISKNSHQLHICAASESAEKLLFIETFSKFSFTYDALKQRCLRAMTSRKYTSLYCGILLFHFAFQENVETNA